MDDFRPELMQNCFNINVPHYHTKVHFLCFSFERRKRGQKKTFILYWFLQYKMKIDNFDEKSAKKKVQQPIVNSDKNVTSHVRRRREEKKSVIKMLCFFNQNGRPDGNRTKRRKGRGRDTLANNGTEWALYKMRKDAMYIIPYKNQYKVRFGTGKKFQGNGQIFEAVFSGRPRGHRHRRFFSLQRENLI